ncbi:MAG: hypothetical protein ACTIAM_06600 [Pseudolactococcus laudensis]|uniref:ASCH domain-containing protein n=1 Tax=Pseudolactococcus laudensis TaxID=1494461 RepID=A0A7V8N0V1_9LACT|nr:hypothetical protein [Lactococcus laudensis]MBA0016556.1 hypothetical protein [Lactococcus laudensis]MBR2763634.1 hypothetical protein [Lactococcus sp.]MBW9281199.1 hypothetical protein [Lactococcus laudensis]
MNNIEILLSIYPYYNDLIKIKKKNFEFRSWDIKFDSEYLVMWVYETRPTMAIKYKMTVKHPISELCTDQEYGLGNYKFIENIKRGMRAYEIVSFEELIKPIFLSDMRELGVNAPQGFAYIAKYPKLKHLLEKSVKFSYY